MATNDDDRAALKAEIAESPVYSPKIWALIQQHGPDFATYLGSLVNQHRELLGQEASDARPFVTGWGVESAAGGDNLAVSIVTYEHATTAIMLSGEDDE